MTPPTRTASKASIDHDAAGVSQPILRFEPEPSEWKLSPPPQRDNATLEQLGALSRRWSHLPGIAALTSSDVLCATGHQAWLWHPGILAKDIAAQVFAAKQHAAWLHLVVDHDVHDAATLPVPLREGDTLKIAPLMLGRTQPGVPTGFQPAIEQADMLDAIDHFEQTHRDRLAVDLRPLRDAARVGTKAETLAQQMTAMIAHVMRPCVGPLTVLGSSDLMSLDVTKAIVRDMLADPQGCVLSYNAAVLAHRVAGVAPLHVGVDVIELPLWCVAWQRPRQRVYARVAGDQADLMTADGHVVAIDDAAITLAPKALMLTAIMRAAVADVFIHGAGGGVYDLAMADWWQRWRGEQVAPMAVASADLRLTFDVPTTTTAERDRAVWFAHHLPHNVDRHVTLAADDHPLVAEKHALLAHMDDDRDPCRRAAVFARIHAINAALAERHIDDVRQAEQRVIATRHRVVNRAITHRRDWPLHWYPAERLQGLRDAISQVFDP